MTIKEAVEELRREKEKRLPHRYHCRAVLVSNIGQYIQLLKSLRGIDSVEIFPVASLFSGDDLMPNYEQLTSSVYQDRWILLPGVSEYLRLFYVSEAKKRRFGKLWRFQSDAASTGRVLIPVWGCKTLWFNPALGLNIDERQDGCFFDCTDSEDSEQLLKIEVLSPKFSPHIRTLSVQGQFYNGVREWYHSWYDPEQNVSQQVIVTKQHSAIRPSSGSVSVRVLREPLDFILEHLSSPVPLTAYNCPAQAREYLLPAAFEGKTLDQAILSALNVHTFMPMDVMSRWSGLSEGQRQLIFLWYACHPDDSYLCQCVRQAENPASLSNTILLCIFDLNDKHPEWVEEARQMTDIVPIPRNEAYFRALDMIPSYQERLNYLSGLSSMERVYLLNLVGKWLQKNSKEVFKNDTLQRIYPALTAYLSDDYPDEILNQYFCDYKTCKLSNKLPDDEVSHFRGIIPESWDSRYSILQECGDSLTFILWIDALGAEWLPLLRWALENNSDIAVDSIQVALAQLPTETCFNQEWLTMDTPYEKLDKLDKLAHKGIIDDSNYYACIEEQIQFVCQIAERVSELIKQHRSVIITGDHGTSRLAARLFHRREGFSAPQDAKVYSHGRYCEIARNSEYTAVMTTQKLVKQSENREFLVFTNYDHFKRQGFAAGAEDDNPIYGESHGGASPEECLVPVIAVHSRQMQPLTAQWMMQGNCVKIRMKKAVCGIRFSRPVSNVQIRADNVEGICTASTIPATEWIVTFQNICPNLSCPVTLLADGTLVSIANIEIKPPLGGRDPF